jgi:hypothetical protein
VIPSHPWRLGLRDIAARISASGMADKTAAAPAILIPGYTRAFLRSSARRDSATTCSLGT